MLKIEDDGKNHINIYSDGKTKLGRLLSNFNYDIIRTPNDGEFRSVEAYWYWMQTLDSRKDDLRGMHGSDAKDFGRKLRKKNPAQHNPLFRVKIMQALLAKVVNNPALVKMIVDNDLPFCHYYVMSGKLKEASADNEWVLGCWDMISMLLKTGASPVTQPETPERTTVVAQASQWVVT